jgi:hypothetical protein
MGGDPDFQPKRSAYAPGAGRGQVISRQTRALAAGLHLMIWTRTDFPLKRRLNAFASQSQKRRSNR